MTISPIKMPQVRPFNEHTFSTVAIRLRFVQICTSGASTQHAHRPSLIHLGPPFAAACCLAWVACIAWNWASC